MVMPYGQFMLKELIFTCSRAYNDDDYAATVESFVKGEFKGYEQMVTSRIALTDIAVKGFEALVEHKDEHIKILVTPQEQLLAVA
jgi:threonine dehydrogenase-like Zn-dependent dehydrogenase